MKDVVPLESMMLRYAVVPDKPSLRRRSAAFPRSRCSVMSRRKPSSSTAIPFSAAISRVRSIGNPYVSCSAKACSPRSVLPPAFRRSATAVSKIVVPARRVCPNATSSFSQMLRSRPASATSSGYCGPIDATEASMSSPITGSWAPSSRMLRMTRRMMRRRTYPRPSLPGSTPSATRNAHVRAWSATTRSRTSSVWSRP